MFLMWFLALHVTTGIFIAVILILFSANHINFRSSDLEMSLEHFNSPITIDSMRVYTYSRTINDSTERALLWLVSLWNRELHRSWDSRTFLCWMHTIKCNYRYLRYIFQSTLKQSHRSTLFWEVTYVFYTCMMSRTYVPVRYHENFWICVDMLFIFFGYSVTSSLITCFCW